jgi:hypothetical protein
MFKPPIAVAVTPMAGLGCPNREFLGSVPPTLRQAPDDADSVLDACNYLLIVGEPPHLADHCRSDLWPDHSVHLGQMNALTLLLMLLWMPALGFVLGVLVF